MIDPLITFKKASPSYLTVVLEILSAVGFPHDGVKEYLDGFLIAQSSDGKVIGCVGLERHGKLAFLRSAAVLPEYHGQKIGIELIRTILNHAAGEGITEVALLTTTAKDYFQDKFGFKEAIRSNYESSLANSLEWNLPRCSSAAFMTLRLDSTPTPSGPAARSES
jgi:amino-acid N-acetyltransferase